MAACQPPGDGLREGVLQGLGLHAGGLPSASPSSLQARSEPPRAFITAAVCLDPVAAVGAGQPRSASSQSDMIHPRDFITEFVDPAIKLSWTNPNVKHLAVHAITQVDVLAEIVALWTLLGGRPKLDHGEASKFRDALGVRQPALAIIRDAHDSHKHGELSRRTAIKVSKGQRPEVVTKAGIFANHIFAGGPPTYYRALVLRLDDGKTKKIYSLLYEAMAAWDEEFKSLRL